MKTIVAILRTLYGIVLVVMISALPIIFTLMLIFTPPEYDWRSGLLRTVLYLFFILPGAAFLNMANFFARLKRANPDVYAMVIENGQWFEHIALAGRSLLTNLHDRVSRIATEPIGRISHGIHRYATVTRYLNLFCFGYLMTGVLSLIGFFVYLKVGS